MPLILPKQGILDWLDWQIRHTGSDPPDLVLGLFANDVTPTVDTVYADLVSATFTGFMQWNLTRSGWTAPVRSGDKAVSTWGTTPIQWTCTAGPQTIYGWYAFNFANLHLMIVERSDTPRPVAIGDTVKLLPRFTNQTWEPCP